MAPSTPTDVIIRRTEERDARRPEPDSASSPPVDIGETEDSLILVADLPGVSGDRLEVRVEGTVLVIEAAIQLDLPEDFQPLYADLRSTRYYRSFSLGSEWDTEIIDAELTQGVLRLRIARRVEPRPGQVLVGVD